jgi:hypothetical protein
MYSFVLNGTTQMKNQKTNVAIQFSHKPETNVMILKTIYLSKKFCEKFWLVCAKIGS